MFRTVAREAVGLLVDDGRLAVGVVIWLLLAGVVLPRVGLGAGWFGLLLFAGLAAVLLDSVVRGATAARSRPWR